MLKVPWDAFAVQKRWFLCQKLPSSFLYSSFQVVVWKLIGERLSRARSGGSKAWVARSTVVPNGGKPLKKSLTKVIFMSFSLQVSVNLHNFCFRLPTLHIQNLWNRCKHMYDPTISRIFWIPFWRFVFKLAQLC